MSKASTKASTNTVSLDPIVPLGKKDQKTVARLEAEIPYHTQRHGGEAKAQELRGEIVFALYLPFIAGS